jgi:hypothetical protein
MRTGLDQRVVAVRAAAGIGAKRRAGDSDRIQSRLEICFFEKASGFLSSDGLIGGDGTAC